VVIFFLIVGIIFIVVANYLINSIYLSNQSVGMIIQPIGILITVFAVVGVIIVLIYYTTLLKQKT
jgi:hypothetical protein